MNKKILIPVLAIVVVVGAIVFVYTSSPKKPDTQSNIITTPNPNSQNPNENMNTTPESVVSSEATVKKPLTDLEINDTVVGTGATAVKGDILTVHYSGKLANGVVFDSSYVRKQPFEFQLGAGMVIEGWDKGFEGMKVGGKRSLSIPARMAYGMVERGSIPAGSDLFFEVELLSIKGK